MTNKYKGVVDLELNGKTFEIRYTWSALSEIKSKYGDEVLANLFAADPTVLAGVLVLGIDDPELTVDYVLEVSPPLNDIVLKIDEALAVAYFGVDGAEALKSEVNKSEKKTK